MAPPNLTIVALYGTIGCSGAVSGGAPLTFPWRERAKPLGVRVVAVHVGCCAFLCFCVVAMSDLLATNDTYFVES